MLSSQYKYHVLDHKPAILISHRHTPTRPSSCCAPIAPSCTTQSGGLSIYPYCIHRTPWLISQLIMVKWNGYVSHELQMFSFVSVEDKHIIIYSYRVHEKTKQIETRQTRTRQTMTVVTKRSGSPCGEDANLLKRRYTRRARPIHEHSIFATAAKALFNRIYRVQNHEMPMTTRCMTTTLNIKLKKIACHDNSSETNKIMKLTFNGM